MPSPQSSAALCSHVIGPIQAIASVSSLYLAIIAQALSRNLVLANSYAVSSELAIRLVLLCQNGFSIVKCLFYGKSKQ